VLSREFVVEFVKKKRRKGLRNKKARDIFRSHSQHVTICDKLLLCLLDQIFSDCSQQETGIRFAFVSSSNIYSVVDFP
jgi:hypothetical protein